MSKSVKTGIIILIAMFIFATAGFLIYQNFFKGANRPKNPTEENLPQPPKGETTLYKGFWLPCLFMQDACQSMSGVDALKDVNANIVAFGPTAKINSKGEARFDVPDDFIESRLKELAERYYGAGIKIHLVIETLYVKDFSDQTPAGGPPAFPDNIVAQTGFLNQYNKLVEKAAKLAQKYQVEFFSPMNEPDLKLGEQIASAWSQEILPLVKKYYSGKVLYKAAFVNNAGFALNFKGYDAIGIDISPDGPDLTYYASQVDRLLDNVLSWAKRDNVPEVLFSEIGVWGRALELSESGKAFAHAVVFSMGQNRVKGFLVLDPPLDLDRGLKGTKTLNEIKLWFKEKSDSGLQICNDLCGDNLCEEVVCLSTGCPCAETKQTCPQDCK